MLEAAQLERLARDYYGWLGGFNDYEAAQRLSDASTDDFVVDFPFAPEGYPPQIKGNEVYRDFLRGITGFASPDDIAPEAAEAIRSCMKHGYTRGTAGGLRYSLLVDRCLVDQPAQVATLLCHSEGSNVETNIPFEARFCHILEFRGDKVFRLTNFFNPLAVLRTATKRA